MYDIVTDIHGCYDEFCTLLVKLGYLRNNYFEHIADLTYPGPAKVAGRKLIIGGDWVDRGPRSLDTIRLIMALHLNGDCIPVKGGHEQHLYDILKHYDCDLSTLKIEDYSRCYQNTLKELKETDIEEVRRIKTFIGHRAPIFSSGNLTVVHAAWIPWKNQSTDAVVNTYLH